MGLFGKKKEEEFEQVLDPNDALDVMMSVQDGIGAEDEDEILEEQTTFNTDSIEELNDEGAVIENVYVED